MEIIRKGYKLVKIIKSENIYHCFYCQENMVINEIQETMLDSKKYVSYKKAIKWANQKLKIAKEEI